MRAREKEKLFQQEMQRIHQESNSAYLGEKMRPAPMPPLDRQLDQEWEWLRNTFGLGGAPEPTQRQQRRPIDAK